MADSFISGQLCIYLHVYIDNFPTRLKVYLLSEMLANYSKCTRTLNHLSTGLALVTNWRFISKIWFNRDWRDGKRWISFQTQLWSLFYLIPSSTKPLITDFRQLNKQKLLRLLIYDFSPAMTELFTLKSTIFHSKLTDNEIASSATPNKSLCSHSTCLWLHKASPPSKFCRRWCGNVLNLSCLFIRSLNRRKFQP